MLGGTISLEENTIPLFVFALKSGLDEIQFNKVLYYSLMSLFGLQCITNVSQMYCRYVTIRMLPAHALMDTT